MTKEEAIQVLQEMFDWSKVAERYREMFALSWAIESLSAEPKTIANNCDLISRADAINAVRYLIYDRQEKGAKPFKWWFIKQRLNALPSADRQTIVRCGECRHNSYCLQRVDNQRHYETAIAYWTDKIEWCSKGERREE